MKKKSKILKSKKHLKKKQLDFLDIAGSFKVKKKIDPVKAREYMEKHYERF